MRQMHRSTAVALAQATPKSWVRVGRHRWLRYVPGGDQREHPHAMGYGQLCAAFRLWPDDPRVAGIVLAAGSTYPGANGERIPMPSVVSFLFHEGPPRVFVTAIDGRPRLGADTVEDLLDLVPGDGAGRRLYYHRDGKYVRHLYCRDTSHSTIEPRYWTEIYTTKKEHANG